MSAPSALPTHPYRESAAPPLAIVRRAPAVRQRVRAAVPGDLAGLQRSLIGAVLAGRSTPADALTHWRTAVETHYAGCRARLRG